MISREMPGITTAIIGSTFFMIGLGTGCFGQPIDAPPCRAVLRGHHGPVYTMVPSPDGRLLVTTGLVDGTVRLWDTETGAQVRGFEQEHGGKTIKIWDVVSPATRRLIKEKPISTKKTNPSGKRRLDSQGRESDEGPTLLSIEARLLPDGRRIAMLIHDRIGLTWYPSEIVIYDLSSGRCETVFTTQLEDQRATFLIAPLFSRARDHLAYSVVEINKNSIDNVIELYSISDHKITTRIADGGLHFRHFHFSPREEILSTVAASNAMTRGGRILGGRVALWDAKSGKIFGRVRTENRKIDAAWLSPNGRDLALCGGPDGNTVYMCYLQTLRINRTLNQFRDKPGQRRTRIGNMEYTPDGRYLVGDGANGAVLFWETKDFQDVLWVKLYPSGNVCTTFSVDGKKIMAAVSERHPDCDIVKVWDSKQFLSLIPEERRGRSSP